MVELFEEDGVRGAKRYLDHLKMEHAFWMDGAESLIPHQAYRHVVRMPDGSPCSIATGTTVTRRGMSRGAKTWRPPDTRAARQ